MSQVALITGGANGIGKALVQTFKEAGFDVVFVDVDDHQGEELASACDASYHHVDVTQPEAIEVFFRQIDQEKVTFSVLVNNVGMMKVKPFLEVSYQEFDDVLKTNLYSTFLFSQHVARRMPTGGGIINIASTRAFMSEPNTESYAASKGAIHSLTHAMAMSLQPHNITVNAISPGWIETGDYQALTAADHSQHPSNRVGKPDDVARLALFLADRNQAFINGENIVIDGGMTKKMIYED